MRSLTPAPAALPGVPLPDPQALAFLRENGVTLLLDKAQLRAVHDAMDALVAAGEAAVALLRSIAGPVPSPLPGQLITLLQMGTGYHRSVRDTIRALFRALNSRRRKAKKERL